MHSTERIIQQLARLAGRARRAPGADEEPPGFTTQLLARLRADDSAELLWRRWSVRSALAGAALAVTLWVSLPVSPQPARDWTALLVEGSGNWEVAP